MPKKGILPRCLILEGDGGTAGPGVIVCGLNPGAGAGAQAKRQREYYLANGAGYSAEVNFWEIEQKGYPYYEKLRKLVRALKITGPILWTDTVKCQKWDKAKRFTQSRFRATVHRCAARHLHRELAACPADWIAIGVGRDAFATLSLLCPGRFVLGVPHCMGQYDAPRNFAGLFGKHDKDELRRRFVKKFQDARDEEPAGLLWLSAKG
jgi:hypothetical protein